MLKSRDITLHYCFTLFTSAQEVPDIVTDDFTKVLEKTLEGPLDSQEIKPVNPNGNQHWILIGKTDTEAETAILWPPDVKSQLIGKDPDAGKDWGQEQKGTTEDEIVG